LKKGAPVNCPVTEDSSTPLHKACAGSKPGHLASVQLLLAGNADVHALNKWRETPLLTAANHGQSGAVEALLAHDADPCKCTDTGWSPLSIAAYKGHDAVVRLLLEDGAPTEEDDPTLSALLQAATKGLPDTVELLLRHGADHTVTTKKGDTALSILVEQNLIDAAVEMVTEYNASIPRCSRDRKKVQRARLLINLRMKQLEREGKDDNDSTDDDEDTDEDHSSKDANVALHVEIGSLDGSAVTKAERKSKKEKPKELLEAKARLAEEALLQELEKEDAQAKVEEAKANSKNAKKKKRKERERLQKLKEDEERRKKEEEELKERERVRIEKEELRRIQRDEQRKVEEERALKEMLEREKIMAAKRKEREARAQLERAEKPQNQRGSGSVSPTESRVNVEHKPNFKTSTTDPTPNRKVVSPKSGKKPSLPLHGSRRWETTSKVGSSQSSTATAPKMPLTEKPLSDTDAAEISFPRVSQSINNDTASVVSQTKSSPSVSPPTQAVGPLHSVPASPLQFVGSTLEHPAVALFRRDKVTELLQRSTSTLALVDEHVLKRIVYRWIVRASHGKDPFIDPILPSWVDTEQLVAFFQRQFIAESRRKQGENIAGYSMESLKEVGTATAHYCHDLAKQVALFRHRIDEQLSPNWTDAELGMSASDGTLTGNGSVISVFWANNAKVLLPSLTFANLRDRHAALPCRFLAATFVAKVLYETFQLVVAGTSMDVRLPPSTVAVLSADVGVSAELWSDPFTAKSSNVYWGHFEHVDVLFGGQKPFSKDDHGSEEMLARHGGSLCVFLPMDTMIASQCVQRMLDILDLASSSSAALSFAVFLNSDCLVDAPTNPNSIDLRSLDPRLGDQQSAYITRLDVLPANNHAFSSQSSVESRTNSSAISYFVMLQNEAGRTHFYVSDSVASRVVATLLIQQPAINDTVIVTPISNDFPPSLFSQHGYFDGVDPISPDSHRIVRPDYGAIGGSSLFHSFSPVNTVLPRGGRRGRLFDLVDDGDEEQQLTDDIMSGMLNNLDVGFFQNSNIGADNVDIEAISLMGIGGRPPSIGNQTFPARRLG
jgi:ankyrin repeat protein